MRQKSAQVVQFMIRPFLLWEAGLGVSRLSMVPVFNGPGRRNYMARVVHQQGTRHESRLRIPPQIGGQAVRKKETSKVRRVRGGDAAIELYIQPWKRSATGDKKLSAFSGQPRLSAGGLSGKGERVRCNEVGAR